MLHEQHFDLSLLPLLTFADEDACRQFRLQCYECCDHQFVVDLEEKAYGLLDRLPDSKLKTHLMAQVGNYHDNEVLIKTANADIATWDKSQLTQEYQYLVEYEYPLSSPMRIH